jgi:hypothetical protein
MTILDVQFYEKVGVESILCSLNSIMKSFTVFLILLVICTSKLASQTVDKNFKQTYIQFQQANLTAITDSLFDFQSELINGRLYHPKGNNISHPYFLGNTWKQGKIWYSERIYDSVMLKYDICSDNLIYLVRKTSNTFPVYLNRQEIKDFIISGHRFTYLNSFTRSDDAGMIPGYYEIAYNGKTGLIVRHVKTEAQNRFTLETEYSQETFFYLRIEGHYISIKNKTGFINSFTDHQNEIRAYMKKINMRFSADNYERIIKVLEFYDNQYLK